ncbi:MAG: helix-turn-helix transcriptional regulator [Oscillospiraceae bacterium]|nr:helix-turn-helix transcriptional regulator [Oscillospiraceae bacterium]MDY2847692.1 helix-turn-helix transcriptional regulator [Oscillospiraceae bacterium]
MASKEKNIRPTEFSRRISEYISESGYTVYKISQITGLGRTAIQHIMSGKFVPTRDFFDKLCAVFPITPAQKEELTDLYIKQKFGNKIYCERKQIRSIIENLPQYYINVQRPTVPHGTVELHCEKAVTGLLNVNQYVIGAISRELQKENPHILTTIPFGNKLMFDNVLQLIGLFSSDAVFEHYLRLFKYGDDDLNENLRVLEDVLKMSVNGGMIYQPYCYYAYKNTDDDNLSVFPYCLLTSEYVVFLTLDYRSAAISSDKRILDIARSHFEKLRLISSVMVETVDNKNMFDIFARSTGMYDKSLEYQPCLTRYLTWDIISARIKDIPERGYILKTVKDSFFAAERAGAAEEQPAVNVFTRSGLEQFAETGCMVNMPGQLLEPLSVSERIAILNSMKKDVGSYYKMIDKNKLNVPDFIQIIYLNNQSCIIACLMEDRKFCGIISERSLCGSFDDFIRSLYENGLTADDSEVLAAIDECIKRLSGDK